MRNSAVGTPGIPPKIKRPDLRPASTVTKIIRLHQGAQKGDAANLGRCPSRTASKSSMPTLNGQRNCQINIATDIASDAAAAERFKLFFGNFPAAIPVPTDSSILAINRLVTSQNPATSEKTFTGRERMTRASGVRPSGFTVSRNASALPAPETSAQTCRASAMVW